MKILVLGGTGALGIPTVNDLSRNNDVFVTSRSKHSAYGRVKYLQGDAHSITFLKEILNKKFDVIIDFLKYTTEDFNKRVEILTCATNHYIFLSSGRIYADKKGLINEDDPRILDTCIDIEYLATDEYALNKARCEDILKNRKECNWTIVRPYISFSNQRLQMGVYEKEHWLRRFLNDKTIIFPKDIAEKTTTITYSEDVAKRISILSQKNITKGQIYNITGKQTFTWKEVIDYYQVELKNITGKEMKIKYIDNSKELCKEWNKYQIIYDRLYSRKFDNRKQEKICGNDYTDVFYALKKCLKECVNNPIYNSGKFKDGYEKWSDILSKDGE